MLTLSLRKGEVIFDLARQQTHVNIRDEHAGLIDRAEAMAIINVPLRPLISMDCR